MRVNIFSNFSWGRLAISRAGAKGALIWLMYINHAVENALSGGIDIAGVHKCFLARVARFINCLSSCLAHPWVQQPIMCTDTYRHKHLKSYSVYFSDWSLLPVRHHPIHGHWMDKCPLLSFAQIIMLLWRVSIFEIAAWTRSLECLSVPSGVH